MSADAQAEVLSFLSDPATHGGAPVQRIDTHAACVFLAGPRALKIKRAVKLPFLDFSTLAKRKAACEAELQVNAGFAPALYRRVQPVTREASGGLALGGSGDVVEWAVELARFDERQTLDHLADAGRIDAALADALGRAVAQAHATARPVSGFGFADVLGGILDNDHRELRGFTNLFPPAEVEKLVNATRAALARLRPLLLAREREGLVRRCHGDLHLGNIVLIEAKPVLFDAIEFDERIATVDPLHDLAFLLMDLIARELRPAANIVLNRYLIETQRLSDLDALAALPLFMSIRAAVRAKVSAERLAYEKDNAAARRSARDYFALALRLIAPPAPQLMAVGGLSGTGKSALARALAPEIAPEPGAVILRSDVERKVLFGVAETERLPQAAYALDVTERVYALLDEKARRVLAAGHSAIVDAVFARPEERAAIESAAKDVRFTGLFLTADLPTRIARVGGRTGDASDADAAVARAQEGYELGPMSWRQVDASGTPEETLAGAVAAMRGSP
jgi:aminoglycoside phosphotransferase family enzyme/predicted kinase